MDVLAGFVDNLSAKIDALHEELEQLRSQSTAILLELRTLTEKTPRSPGGRYHSPYRSALDISMEHKDILSDHDFTEDTGGGERSLSPEVQIQRLTAQLTAAYNRIAALEEQLLSQRMH